MSTKHSRRGEDKEVTHKGSSDKLRFTRAVCGTCLDYIEADRVGCECADGVV